VKLTWRNLNYTVKIKQTREQIKATGQKEVSLQVLKGCTGYALPGQALFIMGASGAGKTSLLNALSDRVALARGSKIEGEILIND